MTFKPMLAGTIKEMGALTYPLIASPKLDGIRCVILDGKAVTRNLKPIPNNFIRRTLEDMPAINGFDGEIMIKTGDFNSVQSAVMSSDGEPDFYYAVFDNHLEGALLFEQRSTIIHEIIERIASPRIVEVEQIAIHSEAQLLEYEQECLADGYEGLILRQPYTSYKFGRSTIREGKLMKLKRFQDDEAEIIGFEPLYENNNQAVTNALGRTERSSHQDGLKAKETLGSLQVVLKSGAVFNIGTGFDDYTRSQMWLKRPQLMGKLVKFKYQELSADGVPRFPVFLGMRDKRDL